MFPDSPTQTLEVAFRVRFDDAWYTLHACSGQMTCFLNVGHKRFACPHEQLGENVSDFAHAAGGYFGNLGLGGW